MGLRVRSLPLCKGHLGARAPAPLQRPQTPPSVQSLGFRIQGSGCRVQGWGGGIWGLGFRIQGSGFRIRGLEFGVKGQVPLGLRVTCPSAKATNSSTDTAPSPSLSMSLNPLPSPLEIERGSGLEGWNFPQPKTLRV